MGLVLSRPSDVSAVEAVPALQLLPGADDPVFVGGPVQPEAFMVLAEFDDVDARRGADLRQRRLHARGGRAGRARDQALPALLGLRRLGRRPARVRARGAVVDRRSRRAGRRLRRPTRTSSGAPCCTARAARSRSWSTCRSTPGSTRPPLRSAAGPTVSPSRRGPGTFGKRNGAGSRPGCTNQHSPVPSLVAASHIASATSSGCSSGNPASAKRAAGRAGRASACRRCPGRSR